MVNIFLIHEGIVVIIWVYQLILVDIITCIRFITLALFRLQFDFSLSLYFECILLTFLIFVNLFMFQVLIRSVVF